MLNFIKGSSNYVPDNTDLPAGGFTPEGLLARSDPAIGQRVNWLDDKLDALEAEREGKWAAAEQARKTIDSAKTAHAHLVQDGASEALIEDARAKLARATTQRATANASHNKVSGEINALRELRKKVTSFLAAKKTEPALQLVPVKISTPKGLWGNLVAGQAAKVAGLVRERDAVRAAPLPIHDVKRVLKRQIDTLAESAAPAISGLEGNAARGPSITFPKVNIVAASVDGGTRPRIPDIEGLLCRYFKDAITADVERAVDEAYLGVEQTFSHDERHAKLRELDKAIAEAERIEGEALWRAIEAGEDILPRADLPARVFLGVAG